MGRARGGRGARTGRSRRRRLNRSTDDSKQRRPPRDSGRPGLDCDRTPTARTQADNGAMAAASREPPAIPVPLAHARRARSPVPEGSTPLTRHRDHSSNGRPRRCVVGGGAPRPSLGFPTGAVTETRRWRGSSLPRGRSPGAVRSLARPIETSIRDSEACAESSPKMNTGRRSSRSGALCDADRIRQLWPRPGSRGLSPSCSGGGTSRRGRRCRPVGADPCRRGATRRTR